MNRLLNVLTVVMVTCAVAVTTVVLRREASASKASRAIIKSPAKPEKVKDWKLIADGGTRFGDATGPVVITQFSDFQCPYCKRLFVALEELRRKYPGKILLSYRHFPIETIHPHAMAAAKASECAAAVEKFESFHRLLYTKQDSIGKISWSAFARQAGMADTASLVACMSSSRPSDRIRADQELGKKIGIRGTPVVIVNELQFAGALPLAKLDSLVRGILGLSPAAVLKR